MFEICQKYKEWAIISPNLTLASVRYCPKVLCLDNQKEKTNKKCTHLRYSNFEGEDKHFYACQNRSTILS